MQRPNQIPNPEAKFAKVDRMEKLFTEAFSKAFDISEDEARGPVDMIMVKLEDSLFTEELTEDYPVTPEDLERLGVPAFVEPPQPLSPAEEAILREGLRNILGELPES